MAASDYPQNISCHAVDVPVSVLQQNLRIHGTLCVPNESSTVTLLVPGSTVNGTYWDFPYKPEKYSFRQSMNNAGYATLAIDRLGTGASSSPPSPMVLANVQALAMHQVVTALREGTIGGPFRKIIIGGHSDGSAVTNLEASTYRDVDGVLLTGFTNNLNVPNVLLNFFASLYPAQLDPRLSSRGVDSGYVTTRPGLRETALHAPGPVDPDVLATSEQTKDVLSLPEASDAIGIGVLSTVSRNINAPTMIANGQRDALFCGTAGEAGRISCSDADTLAKQESPYFSPEAQLHTYVLPGAGHSINLAPNTKKYHAAVIRWLDANFNSAPAAGGR